jgi:hypothetical protein
MRTFIRSYIGSAIGIAFFIEQVPDNETRNPTGCEAGIRITKGKRGPRQTRCGSTHALRDRTP